MSELDQKWMLKAIGEASKAWGKTHPNPAVGAVIVENEKIVAAGFTEPAGGPHAEVVAINNYKAKGLIPQPGTSIYVTLEPCSTFGKTPPCTDAIIYSGIRRVVIGAVDPNPLHSGAGVQLLRDHGIEVVDGVLAKDCEDLNLIFNHQIVKQTPFIAAKIATTIDGKIATRGGLSKWITSSESRNDVMRWRGYFPSIGAGAGTILADNPRLTCRIEGAEERCPIRFIFDRNLITFKDDIPDVYKDRFANKTIVLTTSSNAKRIEALQAVYPVSFWMLEERNNDGGLIDFRERCYAAGIYGVYIEGGASLLSSFLKRCQFDYLFAYRAPKILGDHEGLTPFFGVEPKTMDEAFQLHTVRHEVFNEDQLIRGGIDYLGFRTR